MPLTDFAASHELVGLTRPASSPSRRYLEFSRRLREVRPSGVRTAAAEEEPVLVHWAALELVDAAFRHTAEAPGRSLELALRARALSYSLPVDFGETPELRVASLMLVANSLRASNRLVSARRCWRRLHHELSNLPAGPIHFASCHLESQFWRAVRDFRRALSLSQKAAGGFAKLKMRKAQGLCIASRVLAFHALGQPDRALRATLAAGRLLRPTADLTLALSFHHNLTYFLADLGHTDHACAYLKSYEWMYHTVGSELLGVRAAWMKAHLALQLDGPELAAKGFAWVKDAMAERGLHYDAALAGLDQARALARCGRPDEVRQLAEQLVPVFREHGIEREARMAMEEWVEAVRQQRTDEATVLATVERLKEIARTPLDLDALRDG